MAMPAAVRAPGLEERQEGAELADVGVATGVGSRSEEVSLLDVLISVSESAPSAPPAACNGPRSRAAIASSNGCRCARRNSFVWAKLLRCCVSQPGVGKRE
jgi:hypothetical protein